MNDDVHDVDLRWAVEVWNGEQWVPQMAPTDRLTADQERQRLLHREGLSWGSLRLVSS